MFTCGEAVTACFRVRWCMVLTDAYTQNWADGRWQFLDGRWCVDLKTDGEDKVGKKDDSFGLNNIVVIVVIVVFILNND